MLHNVTVLRGKGIHRGGKVIAPPGNFRLHVLTTNLESFMRRNQKIIALQHFLEKYCPK